MTPFSQFLATQVLINVLYGRYEVVPDEVRNLALGYWGQLPGEVDPDVLDRVADGREPVAGRSGALVPSRLDRLREQHGRYTSDEDLLLSALFQPKTLEEMRDARQVSQDARWDVGPVVEAVRNIAARPGVTRLQLLMGASPTVERVESES